MDNTYVAVAGIGLLVVGVVGFISVTAFFVAVAIRHEVLPRLRPLLGRVAGEARGWIAPERPSATLAPVPARSTPRR